MNILNHRCTLFFVLLFSLLRIDNATYLTAMKSIVFVVVIGFGFRYLAVRESQMIERKMEGSTNINNHHSSTKNIQPEKYAYS